MITITQAKPKECQHIRRFEQRVWRDSHITSPYDAAFFVYFGYVFVAKDKGKIVGVIIAMRTRDNEVKIIDWIVAEKYRRQGIGEQLYQALQRVTKGVPIVAFVASTNTASLKGHEKFGFKKIKKLADPFFLGEKINWWLMRNKNTK